MAYLGVGVLCGLTLALFLTSGGQATRAGATQRSSDAAPSRGAAKTPVVETAPAMPAPPTRVYAEPREPGISDEEIQGKLTHDVPEVIYAAASTCYQGEPGRDEIMRVGYTVHFDGHIATLTDIVLVHSEFDAPRLEACILEALAGLVWQDENTPALTRTGQAAITLLSIQTHNRYLLPDEDATLLD
jgi:hypothetical protein